MKVLLRSTFICAPGDDEDLFKQNFMALNASGLGFDIQEDSKIWEFVRDFMEVHSHVPKLSTIHQAYKQARESEILDRLEILSTVHSITRGDFLKRLEGKAEDRRCKDVEELLTDAAAILRTGVEMQEGREKKKYRGSFDAVHHFLDRSHGIIVPASGYRLSGIANKDSQGFWEHFDKVKKDGSNKGHLCGIQQIDLTMKGAKKYELWIHAAFAGGMKTTFALNWAYSQAINYKSSTLFYSLEMPYHQVQNFLIALHTFHAKFRDLRVKYNIQDPPTQQINIAEEDTYNIPDTNDRGLSYTKIRDAELSEQEEEFLRIVVADYENPENGYGDIHIEVPNPDKDDVTVVDIKARAEVIHASSPLTILFVDHLLLMSPRRWVPSTTERLNEVVRDTKRLAMNFNRGEGIAVVGLFQINREGFKNAEKNGGKYNMASLAYANEAERSADVISAAWLDDNLREANALYLQCLKSRDQAPFKNFFATFVDCCRRLITCIDDTDITMELDEKYKEGRMNRSKETTENLTDVQDALDSLT